MAVEASAVDSLIDGSGTSEQLLNSVRELGTSLPNTKVLTCYYQFYDTETNVMIDWICDMRSAVEAWPLSEQEKVEFYLGFI